MIAVVFLLGLALGFQLERIWSLVLELWGLYREEVERDHPRKPW